MGTNKDYQEIVSNDLMKKETITLNLIVKSYFVILNDEHSSL